MKIAEQFDQRPGVVVGGDGLGAGGNLVSAVRGDPVLAKTISTVDNATTAQGQLVTALALVRADSPRRRPGTTASATTPRRCCLDCPSERTTYPRGRNRESRRLLRDAGSAADRRRGAAAARYALRDVRDLPAGPLERTNFRGRTVSLAAGPALARRRSRRGRVRCAGRRPAAAAALVAGLGAGRGRPLRRRGRRAAGAEGGQGLRRSPRRAARGPGHQRPGQDRRGGRGRAGRRRAARRRPPGRRAPAPAAARHVRPAASTCCSAPG